MRTKSYLLAIILVIAGARATFGQIPDPRNVADLAEDFRVVLTDASGSSASVRVSNVSSALFFSPGSVGPVPKVVLNTVRVPLTAFGGVNLNNVRSVQFTFDERLQGGVLITDVAFASAPQ